MIKVAVDVNYEDAVAISVELRNVADRFARVNYTMYNNENRRLAHRVSLLHRVAQAFEEAVFTFPGSAQQT